MTDNQEFLNAIPVASAPSTAINAAPPATGLAKRSGRFQPWMTDVAVAGLADGLACDTVATLLGVSLRTFERWRAEGLKEDKDGNSTCEDSLLVDFAVRTSMARAEAVKAGHQVLKGHAFKDWRAQRYLLEVTNPEVYRVENRSKVDITVRPGEAEEEDLSMLTDEQLEQKARIEAAMLAAKNSPR